MRGALVLSILFGVCVAAPFTGVVQAQAASAEAAEEEESLKNSFVIEREGGPILVKSNTLELDSVSREFVYKGNVEVRRDELFITSDLMRGFYNDANELTLIKCEGNVVITRDVSLRATSDYAEYNLAQDTIVLTESPELQHKGSALTADKVTIFVKEDRSEAEGDVRVKILNTEPDGKAPGQVFG